MKQYNKNINILCVLSLTLMLGCLPEEFKLDDYSYPFVTCSRSDHERELPRLYKGMEIDFADCSKGVKSRLWTLPAEGGITQLDINYNVIGSQLSSTNRIIYVVFNNAGVFGVRLEAQFNDPSVKLDTTIMVTVFDLIKAQFTSDAPVINGQPTVSAGETIDFQSTTTGGPGPTNLVYEWSFQGGTPATSTARNPSVTYNSPGIWDVTLVASTITPRGKDEISVKGYITVLPAVASGGE